MLSVLSRLAAMSTLRRVCIPRAMVCAAFALVAAITTTSAAAQQEAPAGYELSHAVMERWLAVMEKTEMRQSAALAAGKSEEEIGNEAERFLDEDCRSAGFANQDECAGTIGYLGVLIMGYDPESGRYRDPLLQLERMIAQMQSSTKLPVADKEKFIALLRLNLEIARAVLPGPVPAAHLELMNSYHDRIVRAFR
jgi:hypothetical protein